MNRSRSLDWTPQILKKKRKSNFALDRRHPTLTLNLTPVTVSGGMGEFGQTCVQTKGGLVLVVRLWFGKKGENRELLTGLDTRKIFPAIPLVRVSRPRGA